jgi:hypothetical protein
VSDATFKQQIQRKEKAKKRMKEANIARSILMWLSCQYHRRRWMVLPKRFVAL